MKESQPIRYRKESGECAHGIFVGEARTRISVVLMDHKIMVRKLPKSELKHMTPIDVSPRKAKKALRAAARNKLSKETRQALRA